MLRDLNISQMERKKAFCAIENNVSYVVVEDSQ